MKKIALSGLLILSVLVTACGAPAAESALTPAPTPAPSPAPAPSATPEPTTPASAEKPAAPPVWQWPEINIAAADATGVDKYLSWASRLAEDTGARVNVIPNETTVDRVRSIKDGDYTLTKVDKKKFRDVLEAVPDSYGAYWGYPDLGPFPARIVWIHTLSNSGVYVRGDSPIESIYDIKPGTRWAVRSDTPYHSTIPRAILD